MRPCFAAVTSSDYMRNEDQQRSDLKQVQSPGVQLLKTVRHRDTQEAMLDCSDWTCEKRRPLGSDQGRVHLWV